MDGNLPMTSRGRRTRAKIVDATADLVFEHGAAGTSLDDVREATGTSKSQLFHYFPGGKKELLAAVVERQTERVLDAQRPALDKLDSWAALRRWRNGVIALQRQLHCAGGCPIGSMADELAEHDPHLRALLAESFASWQGYIERGLAEMRDRGELRREADPATLALATMAALQGGLLLTKTTRSTRPVEVALDAALAHVRSFAASSG
jgi:TetR/AcrR family transcriptional repressor of nem operon